MDKIDWSKAPEGATHGVKLNDHGHACWYKDMDFNGYCYKYTSPVIPSHKRWGRSSGAPAHGPLIPRPQPDNKEGDSVEWSAIDSAPKDGTTILAFEERYGVNTSWWDPLRGGWRCPHHGWKPTHWMRLPKPPEKSHRDKVIESAEKVWQQSGSRCTHGAFIKLADDLYEAGLLKLPGDEQ